MWKIIGITNSQKWLGRGRLWKNVKSLVIQVISFPAPRTLITQECSHSLPSRVTFLQVWDKINDDRCLWQVKRIYTNKKLVKTSLDVWKGEATRIDLWREAKDSKKEKNQTKGEYNYKAETNACVLGWAGSEVERRRVSGLGLGQ